MKRLHEVIVRSPKRTFLFRGYFFNEDHVMEHYSDFLEMSGVDKATIEAALAAPSMKELQSLSEAELDSWGKVDDSEETNLKFIFSFRYNNSMDNRTIYEKA